MGVAARVAQGADALLWGEGPEEQGFGGALKQKHLGGQEQG